jgi:hypothetical protein
MREVWIAAAALVALAGSADAATLKMPNGAVRHTWYDVDFTKAVCESSRGTPEGRYLYLRSAEGHSSGYTVERIEPADVQKDDAGNIHVTIRESLNGDAGRSEWFSSKDACEAFIRDTGIKPDQAPHSDIN